MDIVALKTVLVIVPMPVNREVCPVEPVESVSCSKPYVAGLILLKVNNSII